MLDKLIDLVRQNAGAIINNPAIPNNKNDEAVNTAGKSILHTLQGALTSGNINQVLDFFKNGKSASPEIVQKATDDFAGELQNSMGVNAGEAQQVSANVVPQTMEQLSAKTTDPSDNSFNIQEIFNQLSGGKTSGLNIEGMLNKFGGGKLDKDGDGDVDLQDVKALFSGGGGDVFGKVKGLFG